MASLTGWGGDACWLTGPGPSGGQLVPAPCGSLRASSGSFTAVSQQFPETVRTEPWKHRGAKAPRSRNSSSATASHRPAWLKSQGAGPHLWTEQRAMDKGKEELLQHSTGQVQRGLMGPTHALTPACQSSCTIPRGHPSLPCSGQKIVASPSPPTHIAPLRQQML